MLNRDFGGSECGILGFGIRWFIGVRGKCGSKRCHVCHAETYVCTYTCPCLHEYLIDRISHRSMYMNKYKHKQINQYMYIDIYIYISIYLYIYIYTYIHIYIYVYTYNSCLGWGGSSNRRVLLFKEGGWTLTGQGIDSACTGLHRDCTRSQEGLRLNPKP